MRRGGGVTAGMEEGGGGRLGATCSSGQEATVAVEKEGKAGVSPERREVGGSGGSPETRKQGEVGGDRGSPVGSATAKTVTTGGGAAVGGGGSLLGPGLTHPKPPVYYELVP